MTFFTDFDIPELNLTYLFFVTSKEYLGRTAKAVKKTLWNKAKTSGRNLACLLSNKHILYSDDDISRLVIKLEMAVDILKCTLEHNGFINPPHMHMGKRQYE